jgi:hypothetical protein
MQRHPDEKELMKFMSRPDTTPGYVQRTAEWIKKEYPGSVKLVLPVLRKIYREKMAQNR